MEAAPEPLAAGIYNRVSDDRDGRAKSPEQQNEENLAACQEEGWTVAATYTEPASASASKFARKARAEWERLLADLDAGRLAVIVVWETSRSSRKMAPFVALLDACEAKGVLIHVTSHGHTYDLRKYRDRRALLVDGIDSEGESEKTSQRVRRAERARASAGLPSGRLLYGYRREYEYDSNGKRHFLAQVPDETQAVIAREVFTRFAAGESMHGICTDLERRGVPVAYRGDPAKRRTPGPLRWDQVRIRQMLVNPGYIGKRVRHGEIIGDAVWPPLVTEETFWTCQRRIEDNARRRNPGDVHDRWLLSGVARCGVCGAYLRCVPNHSGRLIYQCRSRGGDPSKGKWCTSIVAAPLEAYITETVIARLSQPDALDLFTADKSADAEAAAAALLAKKQELEDLHALAEAGKLTMTALARHEPRLEGELAALEERARAHIAPVVRATAGPDAAARWEQLGLAQRKELLLNVADIRLLRAETQSGRIGIRKGMSPGVAAQRITITWKTA
jgi:DNA invertase Pin-like site-specific DNA recombinase